MSQVNTLGVAAGKVIEVDRGIQANGERLWRVALCRLNQRLQRFFGAIVALFRQITSDPQPNSAYYLGIYVPFLDTTQPPAHKND